MKILFVCHSNIGRSQMAEAFLTELAPQHEASSAGTHVEPDAENQLISEVTEKVIAAMDAVDIEMRHKMSNKLTSELVAKADKVIALNSKEELPKYLLHSPKLEIWNVSDAGGTDATFHANIRDLIKAKVRNLVDRLN